MANLNEELSRAQNSNEKPTYISSFIYDYAYRNMTILDK